MSLTLPRRLNWSHYRTLRRVENGKKRQCDFVFYNFLARCFFLVNLKVGKIPPRAGAYRIHGIIHPRRSPQAESQRNSYAEICKTED